MSHSKRLFLIAFLIAACASTQPDAATLVWSAPADAEAAEPPARGPELPDFSRDPSLGELLAVALARNPRIHSAREKALAASDVGRIDGALPDPRLLLGWYATPVETRVGPQEFSLGIQQSVPFPSKLGDRAELGDTLARRERVAFERVVRDVLVEVVHVAHELIYIDAATDVTRRIAPLLERYAAAAAADAAGTPLSEHFRAETQRAQLENDRVLLAELRAVEAERLRALLDLPAGAPIGSLRAGAVPDIDASFEELLAIARRHNQEIKEAGVSVEAAMLRTSLAKKTRLPDLTLGYTHIFTGERQDAAVPDNGKDAQVVHLGISLPLWVGKDNAEIRRARALERQARTDRRDVTLRIRSRLARAWFQVGNTKRLVELYERVLVPRAETAVRTAEDLHRAGKGSLAGTIETVAALHNFRLAAARARADRGQAVATLEALLGTPFVKENR
jgi:outer membrane protein TolC